MIPPDLIEVIKQIVLGVLGAAVTVIGGSIALRLIVRVVRLASTRARVKPALIDLVAGAVTVAGWVVIIASVLQSLGLNQIALAVGSSLSVATLGLTLAISGNLGDIISGIFLASDTDFEIGFTITTGSLTGVIERLDLRKTRIRTPDGKLHVVPNKAIESERWVVEHRIAPPPPININLPDLPKMPNLPHLSGRNRPATTPGTGQLGQQATQQSAPRAPQPPTNPPAAPPPASPA